MSSDRSEQIALSRFSAISALVGEGREGAERRQLLRQLMSRRLDDVRLAVMMLDGMGVAERTHVVALGITTEGVKIPLGLWEGSTENATLARTLLADLVDRGLDPTQAILFVIDGGKVAEQQFRRIIGYRDLAKLVVAIERHSILVAQ